MKNENIIITGLATALSFFTISANADSISSAINITPTVNKTVVNMANKQPVKLADYVNRAREESNFKANDSSSTVTNIRSLSGIKAAL